MTPETRWKTRWKPVGKNTKSPTGFAITRWIVQQVPTGSSNGFYGEFLNYISNL